MNAKSLPKKLCNNLLDESSPIINLTEDVPEIQINQNIITDENFIDKSFEHGLNNVKRTAQSRSLKENVVNWKVSYFLKMKKNIH